MASCSSLLSEEQFTCSICLEVLTNPVTTQCGHNFCKSCITKYWDSNDLCQCPLCMKNFDRRPALLVNTTLRDVVEKHKRIREKEVPVRPGEEPCGVCTGTKLKALKSCLVCQTSYCETHLEPHLRVAALKKHKLNDPVENLEDRVCKKHKRPLELFCRTDQMCVCQFCTETDHKTHDTVPLEKECEKRKTQMKKTDREVQLMLQERLEKVQEIKLSVETSKRDAEKQISDSVEVFTTLVRSIERSQAELIEVIEEKQKAAEKQAEGFIKELEKEITELKRRHAELEKLSHSENHLHLLQSFTSISIPPHTTDWSQISVHNNVSVETVRRAVSQLDDTLNTEMEKLPGVRLKRIQQYAVDVTLDPDTAYPYLILSEDGKQVRDGDVKKKLPANPKRFDDLNGVLGKQSFSSGRFYYEVQVEEKTGWVLGVANGSINRIITPNHGNEFWTISRYGHEYKALASPPVLLSLRETPQKVGVFVDCKEGHVSFYNVEARSHIYSFTACSFTEKLYPFFCPSINLNSSTPLIITPVNLGS